MPYQNVDCTKVVYTGLTGNQNYIYDLAQTPNFNIAHGLSIQAVYTGSSPTFVIKLQASNDGINWSDISNTSTSVSSAGNTLWDLGFPNYHYVRVVETYTSGTINLTLLFNATNLS